MLFSEFASSNGVLPANDNAFALQIVTPDLPQFPHRLAAHFVDGGVTQDLPPPPQRLDVNIVVNLVAPDPPPMPTPTPTKLLGAILDVSIAAGGVTQEPPPPPTK